MPLNSYEEVVIVPWFSYELKLVYSFDLIASEYLDKSKLHSFIHDKYGQNMLVVKLGKE